VKKRTRGTQALLAAVTLALALATPAFAAEQAPDDMRPPAPVPTREEPTALQKAGDVLLLRPLLAVRLLAGVVALPLAWPTAFVLGDPDWAVDACVREPADRLFGRPLGRL